MRSDPSDLACLQRWMQAVIMHPAGVAAGVDSDLAQAEIDVAAGGVERVVEPSRSLTSLERLHVYANAYYARLLECLRDEFPATADAVGAEVFDGFAFGYLQAHPSTSYTLGMLGAKFPQYLRDTRPPRDDDEPGPDWADFLVDLATFERTCSEVFEGPGAEGRELLRHDELTRIPPESFGSVRLIPVPCLRLVELQFPVHAYATAVRKQEVAEVPSAAATYLVVTRREFVVRRQPVSRPQFELLRSLANGRTLGEAIQQCVAVTDAEVESLVAALGRWFSEWAREAYFERIELPERA
jgi:hypothetical protein